VSAEKKVATTTQQHNNTSPCPHIMDELEYTCGCCGGQYGNAQCQCMCTGCAACMTPAQLQQQEDDEAHWQRHRSGLLAMIDTGDDVSYGDSDSDSDSDSDLFGTHVEATESAAPVRSSLSPGERLQQVRSVVARLGPARVEADATQRERDEAIAHLRALLRERPVGLETDLVDMLCTIINR
jgi:hypothetical protein